MKEMKLTYFEEPGEGEKYMFAVLPPEVFAVKKLGSDERHT